MKREDYISWHEYFMGIALLSAQRSKDSGTQVGTGGMITKVEAARLLTWQSAVLLDQGKRNTLQSSHAKRFAADSAMEVATDAVQVYGGYGFCSEYPVEQYARDLLHRHAPLEKPGLLEFAQRHGPGRQQGGQQPRRQQRAQPSTTKRQPNHENLLSASGHA